MLRLTATITQNRGAEAKRRYLEASRKGIVAAAETLVSALFRAYNSYYTTQQYRSTLQIRAAIRQAATQEWTGTGWYTLVGVPTAMVSPIGGGKPVDRGMVALYWELGWRHKDSGIKYHVPIAVPTAIKSEAAITKAFGRTVKRYMEAP